MKLNKNTTCPHCGSEQLCVERVYETVHNGARKIFHCQSCTALFAETRGTPMEDIKSPLSKVASVLRVRSEGLGLRATARVFGMHKNTVSDWEKRFAAQKAPLMLYAVCHKFISLTFEGDELYTVVGKRGEASQSEGVKVRLKNKGNQKTKPGRKRPKYETPHREHREHPKTEQNLGSSDIHANHVEAQNAAMRRRNSAFRRRTNTYAKNKTGLQRTLDVQQIVHNFVRPHWTTGEVPAVALGIIEESLCLENLLTMRIA